MTITLFPAEPTFEKKVLTDRYYCDGIAAGDINSDGHVDVIAGPFWYAGPDFEQAHEIYPPVELDPKASPSNSMFSFVHDFSGDGKPDVLVLGRVHKHPAMWYENPGNEDDLWKAHFAFERIRGESPTLTDLDNDGVPQLICHWDGRWGWVSPNPKTPREPWAFTAIGDDEDWPQFYHGTGVGDINADGRTDIVINDGWYEQPAKSDASAWPFHRHKFSSERGGAQMFVHDINADGTPDVISAVDAHGWGLAWYEQSTDPAKQTFTEHLIMGDRNKEADLGAAFTQPHALAQADINGDGLSDIVTGKRMWAHGPDGDIEPNAAPVVFWFQLVRETSGSIRYIPHQIDDASGVGVQIAVADLNNNGRPDVLTASKRGTFVFLNNR